MNLRTLGCVVVIAAPLAVLAACGSQHQVTQTSGLLASGASQPALTSLVVNGSGSFTAAGQTSPVSAVATYSDGSTKDVTSGVAWSSTRNGIAHVADGVLTATALGATTVRATFNPSGVASKALTAELRVIVTPPDTFVASGQVREAAAGMVALVRVLDPVSGQSMLTQAGDYSLAGLTSRHLSFTKDGYQSIERDATPNGEDAILLVRTGFVVTPTFKSLAITGNRSFTGIGQADTLTATVRYSDDSTQDVSGTVVWTVSPPWVASVTHGMLGGLTNGRLAFTKDGYQGTEIDATADGLDDVPLQRVAHIAVGDTLTGSLAGHDTQYLVSPDTRCFTCRLITITSSAPGTTHLRLTWSDTAQTLNMWINGQAFLGAASSLGTLDADVPIGVGDSVLHVGRVAPLPYTSYSGNYLSFVLSTSRR